MAVHINPEDFALVRAARQTGTPLAYGDKGGTLALGTALKQIDAELSRRTRG